MTAIDLHQHLWPASFVEALRGRVSAPTLDGTMLTTSEGSFELDLGVHDPEQRAEALDRDGIAHPRRLSTPFRQSLPR